MSTIPKQAKILLKFIMSIEAPRGYDTVYANKQGGMKTKITKMTVRQVIADGPRRTREYGSSAAGAYQFMTATLQGLVKDEPGIANKKFDADMQDYLGLALLYRRGYDKFMKGSISMTTFGNNLAKEWASFPVLSNINGAHRRVSRGETYYAGDALNKSLVSPAKIEKVLKSIKSPSVVDKAVQTSTTTKVVTSGGVVAGTGGAIVAGSQTAQETIDQITPVTDTISVISSYGPTIAACVVGAIVLVAVSIALYKWAKS